ncbi:transforming acidic coiled-coil-containing protein 3-like isoform X2 [Rhopilema esculentum]
MMDDFIVDDFDSLPIKPRGKKASPVKSPIKLPPTEVPTDEVGASDSLLIKESNQSKSDFDSEISFKIKDEVPDDDDDDFIADGPVKRRDQNSSNYQLHFDDQVEDIGGIEPQVTEATDLDTNTSTNAPVLNTTVDLSVDKTELDPVPDNNNSLPNEKPDSSLNIGPQEDPPLNGSDEPTSTKVRQKGVTFDTDFTVRDSDIRNDSSSNQTLDSFDKTGLLGDDEFKAMSTSEFIDNLDFLEQFGESDKDKMARQAALARQSLYQRFDPLMKDGTPIKQGRSKSNGLSALKEQADKILGMDSTMEGGYEISKLTFDDTEQSMIQKSPERIEKQPFAVETPGLPVNPRRVTNIGLVDPLLYTEKDMVAREATWRKKVNQTEAQLKEEIAMRELIEQDAREKQESLRAEVDAMRKVVDEYEKTLIQLSETTQKDTLLKQDTVSELIKEKEQLQADLNAAESSMFDAYKRMEKMKSVIDTYRQNEASLKETFEDYERKLKASEERYQSLRKQAESKMEQANFEIDKVRKSKEVDLAGLQAALKKLQSRNNYLENSLEQKVKENEELTKICDDLISQIQPDS